MSRKVSLDLERSPVGLGLRKIGQWVTYDQFTDDQSNAVGTFALAKVIPAGSVGIFTKVTVIEGFSGDTSAAMNVGDGSDDDKFSYTTFNILAAAENLLELHDAGSSGTETGLSLITSDATITLTVTGGSDFSDITAGKLFVEVFYFSTSPETIDKVSTRYDG